MPSTHPISTTDRVGPATGAGSPQAMTTRRQFLSACSAVVAATTLAPAGFLASPVPLRPVPLASLDFGAFLPLVGSVFRVCEPSGMVANLTLAETERSGPASPTLPPAAGACHEGFSLVFRGVRHLALGQNTSRFEHEALGRFEMFIVPVDRPDQDYAYYQAVFNRQMPATALSLPRQQSAHGPATLVS
jgi:hypothetical protein